MKIKFSLILMVVVVGFGNGAVCQAFVDLGLASGTKWCNVNEVGTYSYGDAVSKFGNRMPTKADMEELLNDCEWTPVGTSGYKVTGPNGKSIFLGNDEQEYYCDGRSWSPQGRYWTSTFSDTDDHVYNSDFTDYYEYPGSFGLSFYYIYSNGGITLGRPFVRNLARCYRVAVRLVQRQDDGYIDLGLPSGTLWKDANENGYYTYDEAVEQFGGKLPNKKQFEELKKECKWWIVEGISAETTGCRVVGPSGKSIFLPLMGSRDANDMIDVGIGGFYWSSDLYDDDEAWYLRVDDEVYGIENDRRNYGQSVRLVKIR